MVHGVAGGLGGCPRAKHMAAAPTCDRLVLSARLWWFLLPVLLRSVPEGVSDLGSKRSILETQALGWSAVVHGRVGGLGGFPTAKRRAVGPTCDQLVLLARLWWFLLPVSLRSVPKGVSDMVSKWPIVETQTWG